MKRISLFIILGLLGFTKVGAQFSLGASAGINLANVKYEFDLAGFRFLTLSVCPIILLESFQNTTSIQNYL